MYKDEAYGMNKMKILASYHMQLSFEIFSQLINSNNIQI